MRRRGGERGQVVGEGWGRGGFFLLSFFFFLRESERAREGVFRAGFSRGK